MSFTPILGSDEPWYAEAVRGSNGPGFRSLWALAGAPALSGYEKLLLTTLRTTRHPLHKQLQMTSMADVDQVYEAAKALDTLRSTFVRAATLDERR